MQNIRDFIMIFLHIIRLRLCFVGDKIIIARTILLLFRLTLLYGVTHLLLSRFSLYLICPFFPDYMGYYYLPINPEAIFVSDRLTDLEYMLRDFFYPIAYLDNQLTGVSHGAFPMMRL